MEAVWPTWAIYRCPQRGICSLMGPSEIELIGSILLLQRLTASINLWFLPKATSYRRHIAWGSHQASEKVKRKSLSRVWLFATPWTIHSPWNSPGQNTGMGSLSFLQGIFPNQGSNPGLPHCRQILYSLSHQGSPMWSIKQLEISVKWAVRVKYSLDFEDLVF